MSMDVLIALRVFQAVTVMINYNQAFEGRGDGFRNLAISLSQIVGTGDSNEPFYKSMIFVFTGAVNMNGRPMKMETCKKLTSINGVNMFVNMCLCVARYPKHFDLFDLEVFKGTDHPKGQRFLGVREAHTE